MTPQELKESIILSAMQGKLVAQIDSEEPSAALLDRIAAEQTIQIKTKKAKASKADAITEEDIPFDIPSTWSWVRFGNLVCYNMGKTPPRAESQWWGAGVPWVSIADMPESGHILDTKESVTHEAIHDKFSERISKAGTLIMSFKLTVGRVSILDIDAVHNEAIISIYPYADENETIKKYLFAILPYLAQSGDSKNAIKGKTLNDTSISNLLIPLPPLEEQKRIVAKLEEILPLIDRYESAWNKLEEFNKRFPGDMQKSILQIAMQGKLVAQDADEESQKSLFEQVQVAYQRSKPLPDISDEEIPYDIPDSWIWVRLGDALIIERGGSPRPIKDFITNDPNGINWIKIGDTERGGKYINATQERIIPEGMKKSRYVQKGDFLLSNSMSFGRPYILNIDGCIHDGWLVLRPVLELFDKDYLYYLLSSPMVFAQFCSRVAGAVVNNLNSDKVALTVVPVPPLAEQKRIVAKLEEILPLCDRLK